MKGMIRSGGASAGRMMAWRVHSYEGGAPRLEEARVPALRAPDELLVRVSAASLNPIDVAMIGGYGSVALNAQRRLVGGDSVEFPLTCGRDFCGVVEARGANVRAELRRGARVWGALPPHVTRGAHAQFVRVREAWVSRAPGALRDAECAGAPFAALTAMALLRSAECAGGPAEWAGARVLLLGLGGAGQAALQLLVSRGAHVTVGAAREQGALATALGARTALDRHAAEYRERVESGGPYAAVLDCAGLGGEEAAARRWRFSRYVTLTSPLLRETDARGLVAGAAAAAARLAAQSVRVSASPAPVRWAFFSARGDDLETLRRLAERGQFRVSVERVFGWREGAAAYARAAEGRARGKLVIDFSDADADTLAATRI